MIDLSRHLRPGDTVLLGQGTSEPRALVEALIEQRHALGGLRVFVGASFTGLLRPEHADALSFVSYGGVGETSRLAEAGVLEILPVHLTEIPRLLSAGHLRVDAVLAQVGTTRAGGHHSLGLAADFLQPAIALARVTLAEVNPRVPHTHGDTLVHHSQLAETVDDDRPLIEVAGRTPTAVDRAIAGHIGGLIPDGATIQVGVGATPDAVLSELRHARDLGLHSGLMTDGLVGLVEAGVITNARKEIDAGISVAGALFGTERLYRWADDNPTLRMRTVGYTHNPRVLASLGTFFCVNSAIEVDLTGQINGEVAAGRYVGTVGGQGVFTRAAISSEHGRSIIALGSTGVGGTVSRIVGSLSGSVVSTARADADIIVTEHGVADLRGASIDERVRRMVAIAHPDFRDSLSAGAAGRRWG